jgi:pimeloyl-ACP methyl ester carboxylesterase
MASPTPKRTPPDPFARYPPRPVASATPDLVDPRFLIKAFAAVVAAAVVCAYLSVCLLVYIGGWHRLLHPSSIVSMPNGSEHVELQEVHFGASATGKPQLTGWWIPSDSATAPTVLFLHDGDGALAYTGSVPLLHAADVNVFAIDYRGYGQSEGPHPTETRMEEDAAVALDYLLYTRHIPAGRIVPYGVGLGGVLAADLAAAHPELPAVVIDQPRPDAYYQMVDAQQSRLLPMHLLVRDRFDIGAALAGVHQPKLLLGRDSDVRSPAGVPSVAEVLRNAPGPKTTVSATAFKPLTGDQYLSALHRFLDESVK